jgi:thiol:disulfide interchange protein
VIRLRSARLAASVPVLLGVVFVAAAPTPVRAQSPIHWTLAGAPKAPVKPGATLTLQPRAEIEPGWHLYALTEPPGGPLALVFRLKKDPLFTLTGTIATTTPPRRQLDPNFNLETEFHEDRAAFTVPVKLAANAPVGPHSLTLVIAYQTCNDRFCLPPAEEEFQAHVDVGAPGAMSASGTSPTSPALPATPPRSTTATPPEAEPPASAAPISQAAPVAPIATARDASTNLLAYLGLAALMGALSLLTPCVFPMVPITVSFFTRRTDPRRAGEEPARGRRESVAQALVYGLGIILTFTAVGFTLAVVFGASGLNRFAADPWLNLGVTALFVAFAMSLFGAWELALPAKLVTRAATADRGRGRFAGTLLMGLAFTLTSFTCTAPFLGSLLVVAAQGNWQWPLAGMLAFSTVFALPFVLLALAPQWIAGLPRSGPWLVSVKATMGVLELAAAMKFLSNVDLVWGWGVFTRPVVIGVWIALSAVLVAYFAGLMKLGRADRLGRPGFGRVVAIAVAIALGVWLGTGLNGRRLGELEAFLPPADQSAMARDGELAWITNDYEAALSEATRLGRPVLVDFTGYTCTNCRWMEANMFPRPEVERELARYVRLRLYTDGRGEMYRGFQQLEQQIFGTVALPYYAVLRPDGRPVAGFGGLTRDAAEYVAFLQAGLN